MIAEEDFSSGISYLNFAGVGFYSFKGIFFARKMELKCTDQVLLTNELLISTVLQNEVRVTDPDSRGGSTYHLPVSVY